MASQPFHTHCPADAVLLVPAQSGTHRDPPIFAGLRQPSPTCTSLKSCKGIAIQALTPITGLDKTMIHDADPASPSRSIHLPHGRMPLGLCMAMQTADLQVEGLPSHDQHCTRGPFVLICSFCAVKMQQLYCNLICEGILGQDQRGRACEAANASTQWYWSSGHLWRTFG